MKFAKMHGAGNDFLVVESSGEERDWPAIAIAMCERHLGVGADGLMLILPSERADFRMRLFNADGSEAEVSGNGVRCLAKYAVERGIAPARDPSTAAGTALGTGSQVSIEAIHDILVADLFMEGGKVVRSRLSMGQPKFKPPEVPVIADVTPPVIDFPIDVDGQRIDVSCMSIGNPHAVNFLDSSVQDYPLDTIGPKVEHHAAFPARVNYGIANVISRERMDVRVWERGAGETLACGSGCCAAMVMAHLKDLVGDKVDITQPGGLLTVEWDGAGDVYLTGPAEFIFEGDWPL